ncbi:MAG: dicarboxylate/amino acid:cation symporter [Candidatus Anaerobiospirillum merdipullorum]|uniref:Dicarboxylate/amino acid:cation symporter n=1 Tax=Candidatus Anaerobiospirillum merdipullorum TaxID=2838450 RepID=A0A9E2NTT8_9GAMM|nr:dicarboxylate/amino acid:cation symporter [Candidatus Anaerobiospirillum merdipullorum]
MSQSKRIDICTQNTISAVSKQKRLRSIIFYATGIILGIVCGLVQQPFIQELMDFIATVFTRLFSFIAVPIIALSLINTLAKLGRGKESGLIFRRTIFYTLLTTIVAAVVAAVLFKILAPANLPAEVVGAADPNAVQKASYFDHIINVIPNNLLQPFVSGNVLSVLLISAAVGLALALLEPSAKKEAVENLFGGLQDILFKLIRWLIAILPIGIMGFIAKLIHELEGGLILGGLATYFAVVIGSNLLQMFVILPLLQLLRGLNPLRVARGMMPAIAVAFFSKSSAGTLPVTMASAEDNLGVNPKVSRFVLPICTTINMNGCAAFILITSLYLMQNAGYEITTMTIVSWIFIATIAAIGNAGVPMGCYFLTISLLSSMQVPVLLMGVILPVYTVIDMLETGVNVWSDATVANVVDRDLKGKLDESSDDKLAPHSVA